MNQAAKSLLAVVVSILTACAVRADVYNLKIVTDASPDYSDIPSLIHSITSRWETPEQKCWALFYWNHIARRQTSPMNLHGLALTDPIRQFNDYGYTMCSTISGINCAIWDAMGFKVKYWDISMHTVPEVEYGGRWHMYDNSMSALYTLCDGRTIAGVADIGKEGACAASGGKVELGHIAKYHCLNATSPNGFLTGADTPRSLADEARCFNPNGLKYRSYYHDWDRGHRYILNLRDGETYTRYYHSLGKTPEFYVPNGGKDPEAVNERYHIRGNGIRTYSGTGVSPVKPADHGRDARATAGDGIYKIEGANVITSLKIKGPKTKIAISTTNGLTWQEVGEPNPELKLVDEVNGAYEVLVKASPPVPLEFETTTMLNSKTQPQLRLGKNEVYVGAGDQTESIVFWPDLRGENYRQFIVAEQNIATKPKHPEYMGVMYAARPNEDAWAVFKIDAPRDITRITYGGRLYNRAPKSHIDFLHSFDGGKTWTRSYSLTSTEQPWDVIHYETITAIPPGTKSVLFKYLLNGSSAGTDACSLYAVRMEANHQPEWLGHPAQALVQDRPDSSAGCPSHFQPLAVTFNWSERQSDYSLVERSHTELITKLPHRYTINVGGADHPVVNWLRVGQAFSLSAGYSDGKDVGGEKFIGHWLTRGKNLAQGRPYTVSVPSGANWGAGDPDGKKLTDGVVGPPYAGGIAPSYALLWDKGTHPEITVDLGEPQTCAAFAIDLGAGWPWWDALKGQVKDRIEVFTSLDGQDYTSQGCFALNLRWKDLPVNYLWPDDETMTAHLYDFVPPTPVRARYVRFKITPERTLIVSEVQVLDSIKSEPFDLRIALPEGSRRTQ